MHAHEFQEVLNILWKGIVPPLLAMVLVVYGLVLGSPVAWAPILITVAVLATLFIIRVNREAEKDVRAQLKPMKIRPVQEVLDECTFLKRKDDS